MQVAQARVHEALCDNINTATVMDELCALVKHVNVYLAKKQAEGPAGGLAQPMLLRKAAAFVTRIMSAFGLVDGHGDRCGGLWAGERAWG